MSDEQDTQGGQKDRDFEKNRQQQGGGGSSGGQHSQTPSRDRDNERNQDSGGKNR
ncbi:MAG TPA: hypothetical protein VMT94_07710 [Burkholderiales bacterium]|nr:hypothetical protein [Burkholderiales bacterium]